MDTELLVDERIEDGRKLLSALTAMAFDVTAAFWVRTSGEGLWFLYIASPTVRGQVADAYRAVYSALSQLQTPSLTLSEIKLVEPTNPIAADAITIRDRYAARIPTRYNGKRLGGLEIEEAYIYPRTDRNLSRAEALRTISELLNRTGPLQPSVITLRDGSTVSAIPVGLQIGPPGSGVMVVLRDAASQTDRSVSIDDIASIL